MSDALEFPFDAAPAPGRRLAVAAGIDWVRQPLPFALDHVNCWLLDGEGDGGDGVAMIDTGVDDEGTRANWDEALGARVPRALLATHFHPDHSGMAGRFAAAGTTLHGSAVEIETARRVWHADPVEHGERQAAWYAANGLPPDVVERARRRGNHYRRLVAEPPPPAAWTLLDEGDALRLGERDWRVLVGRGHAPRMLLLHDAADEVLIAADQVLPSISPNVSLWPGGIDPDPLASFLDSLAALRALPADTLVLPSHGRPFRGLHARLDALAAHHAERLERVREACREPKSAADLFEVLFRRELDAQQMSFALGEALAHARRLERTGELVAGTGADGVTRYRLPD